MKLKSEGELQCTSKFVKKEAGRKEKPIQQEEYTKDNIHIGLWQGEAEVDNMLFSYKKSSEKINLSKHSYG